MINKMTMENSLEEIQKRLGKLMRVRAEELVKKKQLVVRLLAIEKKKVQMERDRFDK
jgi:hypothetical protein